MEVEAGPLDLFPPDENLFPCGLGYPVLQMDYDGSVGSAIHLLSVKLGVDQSELVNLEAATFFHDFIDSFIDCSSDLVNQFVDFLQVFGNIHIVGDDVEELSWVSGCDGLYQGFTGRDKLLDDKG